MKKAQAVVDVISKAFGFLRRQKRDWKITVARSSIATFVYQMILPYQSIYTVALGANATQLGVVNSTGMGVAGLLSLPAGWFIDRVGVKAIYLIGIMLLATSYLVYGLAQSWQIIIIAMIAYQIGYATSVHSCSTVCGNSLENKDRATAMSFCETIAGGVLGIAGPIIGASLVTIFGGIGVSGIRPLYYISFLITIGTFIFLLTQLSNRRWGAQCSVNSNFFKDFSHIFRQGHNLKRWIIIVSVNTLPMGMVLPFSQVFAHEVKGADQYTLGAMVAAFALTPLVLGIPMGRLADRIGRKKALYLLAPLFWASNLILIWAPGNKWLIVAGVLQGIFYINETIAGAMSCELVPPEQLGKWLGINRFFRLLISAASAFIAGVIWDNIGPQYVFLTVVGIDIIIRIPMLIGMPETLGLRIRHDQC